MATQRQPDAVDAILAQWHRERPDLDVSPMGPIGRRPNPDDARSSLVQLTPEGLALIDRAVEAHVANEHRILAPLKAADLAALGARLALLLTALESPTGQ